MGQYKYTVCVRCFTYNHSQYITDALNGFVSQQTTFPFVVTVVDDASTDGEQDVIRSFVKDQFDVDGINAENRETEYAHITCAPHKSNKSCNIVVLYLKENLYSKKMNRKKMEYLSEWLGNSKYHALCEGDDYWIDPLKLQKQVDFLEANPEYGLVHTNFQSIPVKRLNTRIPIKEDDNYLYEIINHNYRIATQTVVYRFSLFTSLPKYYETQNFMMGDLPLWIEFAKHAKIKYLEDNTSVYRALDNSASHSSDMKKELTFVRSAYDCSVFYIKKYNLDISLDKRNFYVASMKIAFKHQCKDIANKLVKDALRKNCVSLRLLAFYLGTHLYIVRFIINLLY